MNTSKLYITSLVGAVVLVSAFTAAPGGQKYSDWSEPINLGPNVNSTALDRGPAISKDGLSLYFASNRPDSIGGEDIYVSQRETRDDEWGPAMNLGPIVNTIDNEMVPAFSRDGHLLFFASNRPLGRVGGVDIWVSRREQTHDDFAWQPAENLGAGVNSVGQDEGPSYFENDEVGVPQLYFSGGTNRPGGAGIYVSDQAADGTFGPAVRVFELGPAGSHVPQFVMTAWKYSSIHFAQVLLAITWTCMWLLGRPCSTHGQHRSTWARLSTVNWLMSRRISLLTGKHCSSPLPAQVFLDQQTFT